MFKALSRLFSGKPKKAPRLSLPVAGAVAATVKTAPVSVAAAAPSAKEKWKADATKALSRHASPEELAGLTPDMTPAQIADRLAKLYQRHNRAASSLDPQLREEAEFMLETLAGLREKYLN